MELRSLFSALALSLSALSAVGDGTSFTYQGRLTDNGVPANGRYDLQFSLHDSSNSGIAMAGPLNVSPVPVSNGLFTVTLDFGAGVFSGGPRWLQLRVRTNGSVDAFSALLPRQPITTTPYAIQAAGLSGPLPDSQLSANVARLNASNYFSGPVSFNPASVGPGAFLRLDDNGQVSSAQIGSGLSWDGVTLGGTGQSVPFLTVSARGIANGLAAVTNAGLMFGPDTPGTTSYGLQEAINSLPRSSDRLIPGGGVIFLGTGIFYTTDTINVIAGSDVNRTNAFTVSLIGPGMTAGGIVYVGNTPKSVLHVGAPGHLNNLSFNLRDLFVASTINAATNIVFLNGQGVDDATYFGGIAKANIEECWFGWWEKMTNNPPFGFGLARFGEDSKHNLVGVDVRCSYDEPILIQNCYFTEVLGIGWACDHGTIRGCEFGNCGLGYHGISQNDWPATSPFYLGATITCGIIPNGNEVWQFEDNTFINSWLAYYGGAGNNDPRRRASYNDQFEFCVNSVAVPTNTGWRIINPHFSSNPSAVITNHWVVTNTSNFSTWMTQRDTNNLVRVLDLYHLYENTTGLVADRNLAITTDLTVGGKINGVKVYKALMNQSGAAAPVATVLENSLGGTIVWTRSGAGRYLGTLGGAFPANKTFVLTGTAALPLGSDFGSAPVLFACNRGDANTVTLHSAVTALGAPSGNDSDDSLANTAIEIQVYP